MFFGTQLQSHFVDPASSVRGQAGIRIISKTVAELCLLEWIPINNRPFVAWLDSPVFVNRNQLKYLYFFVAPICVPTDCSSAETEDEFYWN